MGFLVVIQSHSVTLRRNQRKKTRFEIPRILAKYRRLAMHVKEMQPSVSVLDATDRERTQRIVASFIINLFKSLSESAQDFDSQQPFTRSPPFAPPLIRCARQGQAAAAARRLCAHMCVFGSGAHLKVCGHALLVAPLVPGPGRPFDDEFSTLGCRGRSVARPPVAEGRVRKVW